MVKLSRDWRRDKFLWKPIAEHYNGALIITNPLGAVRKATVVSVATGKEVKLTFRTSGVLGDIFTDYRRSGKSFEKSLGAIYVKTKGPRNRTYLIPCPSRRSDGQ